MFRLSEVGVFEKSRKNRKIVPQITDTEAYAVVEIYGFQGFLGSNGDREILTSRLTNF